MEVQNAPYYETRAVQCSLVRRAYSDVELWLRNRRSVEEIQIGRALVSYCLLEPPTVHGGRLKREKRKKNKDRNQQQGESANRDRVTAICERVSWHRVASSRSRAIPSNEGSPSDSKQKWQRADAVRSCLPPSPLCLSTVFDVLFLATARIPSRGSRSSKINPTPHRCQQARRVSRHFRDRMLSRVCCHWQQRRPRALTGYRSRFGVSQVSQGLVPRNFKPQRAS